MLITKLTNKICPNSMLLQEHHMQTSYLKMLCTSRDKPLSFCRFVVRCTPSSYAQYLIKHNKIPCRHSTIHIHSLVYFLKIRYISAKVMAVVMIALVVVVDHTLYTYIEWVKGALKITGCSIILIRFLTNILLRLIYNYIIPVMWVIRNVICEYYEMCVGGEYYILDII
jgi:hypothetical protein